MLCKRCFIVKLWAVFLDTFGPGLTLLRGCMSMVDDCGGGVHVKIGDGVFKQANLKRSEQQRSLSLKIL